MLSGVKSQGWTKMVCGFFWGGLIWSNLGWMNDPSPRHSFLQLSPTQHGLETALEDWLVSCRPGTVPELPFKIAQLLQKL